MSEDFTSIRFGIYDLSKLGLTVVSSSNRYNANLLPAPSDTTIDIPGGPAGQYYLGSVYKNREFTINVAFDSIKEPMWRKLQNILATDKLQDLVFNHLPYKTYKAKLKSKPEFKYVCFRDPVTKERIYKGEGTLNFIAYHPYAYCFNKYVVRAADYYKCTIPQDIITNSINDNPYEKKEPPKTLTGLIKDHYNVRPNMGTPWKGGYPSIEQVQWGELYFKLNDHNNPYNLDCADEVPEDYGMIIDVRNYWNNVPQWESTAKLLFTPTLDYDQGLIYMPQYSTTNYYNMDTGLNRQNALIGSRILVYNPGDIEIPFELKLGNLTSRFRNHVSGEYFRISRYNVQRLSIQQAVDWIGMRTRNRDENEDYKYGTRYVTIIEKAKQLGTLTPHYRELALSHPNYVYIAEPIPRDRLGHFIRLFYWQSSNLDSIAANICSWEEGKEIANRYEELLELCIDEDEKNELYWNTLFTSILDKYREANEVLTNKFFSNEYTYEDFCYDFIFNPPEYIRQSDKIKNYGDFVFNIAKLPTFITEDYLDINSDTLYAARGVNLGTSDYYNSEKYQNLFLDFDSRMLYNINDNKNTDLDYNANKNILTEAVERGKWFLLPPGWSLIDIAPIVDETIWGGKRWLDARPFKWGTTNEEDRATFNMYEQEAILEYVSQASPLCNLKRQDITNQPNDGDFNFGPDTVRPAAKEVRRILETGISIPEGEAQGEDSTDGSVITRVITSWNLEQLEDLIRFRRWYDGDPAYERYKDWRNYNTTNTINDLGYEIWRNRIEQAEYGFLKTLADLWRVNHCDANGVPLENQDIDIWWWFANNYMWENFPPLYWGYLDLLNQAQIKYTPQYY